MDGLGLGLGEPVNAIPLGSADKAFPGLALGKHDEIRTPLIVMKGTASDPKGAAVLERHLGLNEGFNGWKLCLQRGNVHGPVAFCHRGRVWDGS